jgi:hypothetical protein
MSLPVTDLPSGEGIQFSFSTNSRGYGSDGCGSFAVVVYCDYEKPSAIGQRDMISAAEYVRPFRDRQVVNRSLQLPALPAEYERVSHCWRHRDSRVFSGLNFPKLQAGQQHRPFPKGA